MVRIIKNCAFKVNIYGLQRDFEEDTEGISVAPIFKHERQDKVVYDRTLYDAISQKLYRLAVSRLKRLSRYALSNVVVVVVVHRHFCVFGFFSYLISTRCGCNVSHSAGFSKAS